MQLKKLFENILKNELTEAQRIKEKSGTLYHYHKTKQNKYGDETTTHRISIHYDDGTGQTLFGKTNSDGYRTNVEVPNISPKATDKQGKAFKFDKIKISQKGWNQGKKVFFLVAKQGKRKAFEYGEDQSDDYYPSQIIGEN